MQRGALPLYSDIWEDAGSGCPCWGCGQPSMCENARGAALPFPIIQIPKGGGRLRRPEPKKEGLPIGSPSFLAGTVKIDILSFGTANRKTAQRPFWAAALLRRTGVFPKAKPWRRGNKVNCRKAAREGGLGHSLAPSISISNGFQRERHAYGVSFSLVREAGLELSTALLLRVKPYRFLPKPQEIEDISCRMVPCRFIL